MCQLNHAPGLRATRKWAKRVIVNATDHNWQTEHPNVKVEWVERTLVTPYRRERDDLYYGEVPEVGNWFRVVVEGDRLHTAYLDRCLIKRVGRGKL